MAKEEHFAILKQGVRFWNEWREMHPEIIPDLTNIDFNNQFFIGTKLHTIGIAGVNLPGVNFVNTDLRGSNLAGANFNHANLSRANFSGVDLTGAKLIEANLSSSRFTIANLFGVHLVRANLQSADFSGANLSRAELIQSNLIGTKFVGADLSGAGLTAVQAIAADFEKATLTGACLEDWHITERTNLDSVTCEYVYLKNQYEERCPNRGYFALGDFTRRFQKALDTVDLIFRNGVDWIAFSHSLKVETESEGILLKVKAIEEIDEGIILIKVKVPPEADKAKIQSDLEQKYRVIHETLEESYQVQLRGKDKQILRYEKDINWHREQINRKDQQINQFNNNLSILTQALPGSSNYEFINCQFAGGVADQVQGNQTGGDIHNHS